MMESIKAISKMTLVFFLSSILLVFAVSGCVSSKKYQALESQYASMEARNAALEQEVAKARADNAKLARQKAEQQRIMEDIIKSLEAEVAAKSAEIKMLQNKLVVSIEDRLFFASGSAEVNGEGRDILKRLAPILKKARDQEIRVLGHTDSVPIGKDLSQKFPSNWELSTARATSIIQILQWGFEIDPQRLVAQGVGQHRPIVDEAEWNRGANRVVEIILTPMRD
jgi:chemotaxis protein MotB